MTHCHSLHGPCKDYDGDYHPYCHNHRHHIHYFPNHRSSWPGGCGYPGPFRDAAPRGGHDCYYNNNNNNNYRPPWDTGSQAAEASPRTTETPEQRDGESNNNRRLEELANTVEQQAAKIAFLEQKLGWADEKFPETAKQQQTK